MPEVKRYTVEAKGIGIVGIEVENGRFVEHDDYQKLKELLEDIIDCSCETCRAKEECNWYVKYMEERNNG